MDKRCANCEHYSPGVTDEQRKLWSYSNWGLHADGVCNHYFPRGYIACKPPHPAMATGHCFQWEEKSRQMTLEEVLR